MVSVCIATLNGAKYLKKQLDSILSQLNTEDEIIISDDGSTDETLNIISSYKDSRIKLLHHTHSPEFEKFKYCKSFYYVTNNYENALLNAKGDYIFLADQDDIWPQNKIEKMLTELKTKDCVMCNYNIIDENDTIISREHTKTKPFKNCLFYNTIFVPFQGCCMAFTKNELQKILPFPKNLLSHDLWIGSYFNQMRNIKWIQEPLHMYRRHTDNVSPTTTKARNPIHFMIYYRLAFLMEFLKRLNKIKRESHR